MDTQLNPKTVRNRVVEMILVRGGDLLDHDGNWRVHPLYQRSALEGRLEETGITDVLKVYRSARHGGKLTIIDGHLRKGIDPDIVWPAVVLDLDDDEADDDLAFGDAITGWAETNPLALQGLLERARSQNDKTREANRRLQEQIAEQVAIARRALGDPNAPPKHDDRIADHYRLAPSVHLLLPFLDRTLPASIRPMARVSDNSPGHKISRRLRGAARSSFSAASPPSRFSA